MGWATGHIEKLLKGETVSFRPSGNSMTPRINSGQLCTVAPVKLEQLEKGDIVLCVVRGKQYLHLVTGVKPGMVQISNNKNFVNGWTSSVFGRLVSVL